MWPRHVILLIILMLVGQEVAAQVYNFENMAAPESKELRGYYMFYVLDEGDNPAKLEFRDLVAHVSRSDMKDAELKEYESLQVSILHYGDPFTLDSLLDKAHFCTEPADVTKDRNAKPGTLLLRTTLGSEVFVQTFRFPASVTQKKPGIKTFKLKKKGAYLLSLSNCGRLSNATVSGSVVITSSYGMLPGSEIKKMNFYALLSVTYAAVAVVWLMISLQYGTHLSRLHWSVASVVNLGLLEVVLKWVYLRDWNATGEKGFWLCSTSLVAATMKSVVTYMLLLLTALGWGITRSDLSNLTILKLQGVGFVYMVLFVTRDFVLSHRLSCALKTSGTLGVLAPAIFLDGCIFFWIFTEIGHRKAELDNSMQTAKVQLFDQLRTAMIMALSFEGFARLLQVADVIEAVDMPFQYKWLLGEGTSHMINLLVVVFLMTKWMPNEKIDFYSSFEQIGQDETGELCGPAVACAEEEDTPMVAEEGRGGRVSPQTIGFSGGRKEEYDNILETEKESAERNGDERRAEKDLMIT